jgi:hypothetical protein
MSYLDEISTHMAKYTRYNIVCCNMNASFSFDLFVVYKPEYKQQLRTME